MSDVLDWGPSPTREVELDRDLPLDRHEPAHDPVSSMHRTVSPLRRRHAGSPKPVRARSRTYRATLPRQTRGLLPDAHAEVLGRAAAAREAVLVAQVAELQACVDWAALHPEATHDVDVPGGERTVAVAGEGAPEVAEFAVPELALRLGVSTDSGRHLLGDAVELAHRLPQCWEALLAGGIPVFKARRVARATRDLPLAAAGYVDGEVAPYLHAIGVKALDQVVETAIWRFDLPRAVAEAKTALDRRGFVVDLDPPAGAVGDGAVCQVWGGLDRAVADLAHHLLLAGSTETLEVRRSQALGMLARRETPVAVPDQSPAADDRRAQHEEWDDVVQEAPVTVARRRDVVLHVHLSDAALRTGTGVASLEGSAHPVSVEQVRGWLTGTGVPGDTVRVTVRPVVDLGEVLASAGYVPATELAEQVVTRDRTCVFPHCTRSARSGDLDHVVAWQDGGPTSSDNLAALCRRHHRLKTHHPGWTYRVLHPGTYLWTDPGGGRSLRDPGGTHRL